MVLRNNLKHFVSEEKMNEVFKKFGFKETIRSEEIDKETIYQIFKFIKE